MLFVLCLSCVCVFVEHFVYSFDIADEGRVVMVSAGEVHILLFEICFSDFEPTVVFFQPLYALFQSGRMASIIPMVTIIPYVADLCVNKSLHAYYMPINKTALHAYHLVDYPVAHPYGSYQYEHIDYQFQQI